MEYMNSRYEDLYIQILDIIYWKVGRSQREKLLELLKYGIGSVIVKQWRMIS